MMATAFMGYVLPWGSMSFAGATVITNLSPRFPSVGVSVSHWLWGRLRRRRPDPEPLLRAAFPVAVHDRRVVRACMSGRCTSAARNNPDGVEVKDVERDTVAFTPTRPSRMCSRSRCS